MSRYRYVATVRFGLPNLEQAKAKFIFTTTATKTGTVHQAAVKAAEKRGWTDCKVESIVPDLTGVTFVQVAQPEEEA